jgi:apolipoprotein N-acyltransferase
VPAFLAGAATVLGFAPFGLFPLPWLTLAFALRQWQGAASPRAAAGLGFAFGWGLFLAGVSWVYVSMHRFGGMPGPLAALATVLFCALLALFPAASAWLARRLRGGGPWRDALAAAAAWTGTEWLRGWVLTGFPWLALGYAQAPPGPLAGYAPLLGVWGVTFLTVLLAALLACAVDQRRWRVPAAAAFVGLVAAGFGLGRIAWTEPKAEPLQVSLLQGNIEQSLKWRPELLDLSLQTYLQLAQAHPARLTVLPETALPTLLHALPPDYLMQLKAAGGGDLLLGIATREADGRYYNSAIGLAGGALQRYGKQHLVPFGEFTPPGFAWTLALLRIPMSDFARGGADQPPLSLAGEKVAVNICYEDVFGAEIRRALPEATLLVNLSNVAWFGDSLAPAQHLQIAQLRALETGRTMLRATNTGMTAVVDPDGGVRARLPAFQAGALQAQVRGYTGSTPYVRWGDGPVLAAVCVFLLLGLPRLRRR